jgi:ABC-type dipeptide/oligopeptide/nickel transport system ATPase subunit
MPIFEVDGLSLHYLTRFGEKIPAVSGVSFSMEKGEVLGIAGESGCGKSTLVNGCMGLFIPPLNPTSGDVRVAGESIMGRTPKDIRKNVLGRKVSMIPQGAFNSLNPTRKIKDLAADMVASHEQGVNKKEIYDRLRERFKLIGMDADAVLNAYPIQLTAGTRQRCVIGISTLLNPQVVIADEPTSALDVTTQKSVITMIFDLLDKGIFSSMIFITHELAASEPRGQPYRRHVCRGIRGTRHCQAGHFRFASSLYQGAHGVDALRGARSKAKEAGCHRRRAAEFGKTHCRVQVRRALSASKAGLQNHHPSHAHGGRAGSKVRLCPVKATFSRQRT